MFCNTKQIGEKESKRIRSTFGPYPASVASKAFTVVQRLKKYFGNKPFLDSSQMEVQTRKEFGSELPFSFLGQIQCASMVPVKSPGDENDSLSEDEGDLTQCMMQLTNNVTAVKPSSKVPIEDLLHQEESPTDHQTAYNGKWLQEVCQMCSGDARTWRELYALVFDTLSSSLESDRIQEEVCTYVCCTSVCI